MIENPIGVESFNITLESVEAVSGQIIFDMEVFIRAYLKITSGLAVVKVDTEFRTVQIEYQFFFGSLVFVFPQQVFYVEL